MSYELPLPLLPLLPVCRRNVTTPLADCRALLAMMGWTPSETAS